MDEKNRALRVRAELREIGFRAFADKNDAGFDAAGGRCRCPADLNQADRKRLRRKNGEA
jgi:hypothetical protein